MRKLQNSELGRKSINQFRQSQKSPFVIVLDNVRSHNNVGSVFRTADAFLTGCIYLCGITATPPHRDIHKTALGATESVSWKYFRSTTEAIEELRNEGYVIVAVEQAEGSVDLADFIVVPGKKYALVFGHEIDGVGQSVINLCDNVIEIPQFGTKHSFNIAVSAGIVLWELTKKQCSDDALTTATLRN
ncbi:MAG TPA: RNA methyltransferase [Bacteroidales bacterium]|nr:RNA methyltransferase [Bacteroidales bacterium]HPJ60134.1 RNA methyltransferase [Bacteroidales bacterium]HPR11989.1 RNA methyltransferase [Bacteroidales bacterium]